jgi:hypothetical protein
MYVTYNAILMIFHGCICMLLSLVYADMHRHFTTIVLLEILGIK